MPNRTISIPSEGCLLLIRWGPDAHLLNVQTNLHALAERAIVVRSLRPLLFNVRTITIKLTDITGLFAVTTGMQECMDVGPKDPAKAHDHSSQATGPVQRACDVVERASHEPRYA